MSPVGAEAETPNLFWKVKMFLQDIKEMITLDPEKRAELKIEHAKDRQIEIETMTKQNKPIPPEFTTSVNLKIAEADDLAKRNMIQISLREGRTIHHDSFAKDGSGKIKLRYAPKGTGIIAGGPVRAVCEVLGIKDIVAKSIGSANPHNVIRACMKALSNQTIPKNVSSYRNKKVSEIIQNRE